MDLDVSIQQLKALIERGSEDEFVDYKRNIDLSTNHGIIEFAKDVSAFSDKGGWIVVGVSDDGTVVGVDNIEFSKWDESKLRQKVDKYCGSGFLINSAVHNVDGLDFVIIQIRPHPEGACIMSGQGQYKTSHRREVKTVFKPGDVFTRHGSSSERVNQFDMRRILGKNAEFRLASDNAAKNARYASSLNRGSTWAPKPIDRNWASGHLGWSASTVPADMNERMFYGDFQDRFWSLTEVRWVRKDGQRFSNNFHSTPTTLVNEGTYRKAGLPNAHYKVVVSIDGWISISFADESEDLNLDEVVSWWVYGSWMIAMQTFSLLGWRGELFSSQWLARQDSFFGQDKQEYLVKYNLEQFEVGHEGHAGSGITNSAILDVWDKMHTLRERKPLSIDMVHQVRSSMEYMRGVESFQENTSMRGVIRKFISGKQ